MGTGGADGCLGMSERESWQGALPSALEALQHLPQSSETLESAFEVRVELWNAITPLGHFGRAREVLHEAEAAAERLGDERQLGRVWGLMGNLLWIAGDRTESEAVSQRAGAVGERIGDLVTQISANTNLGLAAYETGEYRQARAFQERILQRD